MSASAASTDETPLSSSKHILFDMPVSNNGARCRLILYKKGVSKEDVDIISPVVFGGLKTPEFLARSPKGLMPCLTIQKEDKPIHIPESDTISRYLMSEYAEMGPSFLPNDPQSNLLARYHDFYLTTIQGCLYKDASRLPFGNFGDRKSTLQEFREQLGIIDGMIDDERKGIYLLGEEVSYADATIFPTMVFAKFMLPKFEGGEDVPPLPPKISAWFETLRAEDADFAKVHDEIWDVLKDSWDANGRWDTIHLAGLRDEAPPSFFEKLIAKEIPADIVMEDDRIMAFKDINPMAPAHVLVIPKDRQGLTNLRKATDEHRDILGRLMVAAGEIAGNSELGFGDGARIVVNDGPDGGQEVMHLHVHVLGGRQMEGKLG